MTGLSSLRNSIFALIAVAVLLVGASIGTPTTALAAVVPGHQPDLYLMMTNGLTAAAPTTPTPAVLQDQRLRDHSTELIGSAGDLSLMQQHLGATGGLADDDPSFAAASPGLSFG